MAGGGLAPETVVNIVFFALVFNALIMALAFSIVAGIAEFITQSSGLVPVFGGAAGFLGLIATLMATLRSALVELLSSLVVENGEA